jgi:ketosteroid isomerase-like protein
MKRLLYLLSFCFVINTATYAQSANEKEVAATVEKFKKALLDPTKENLDELTAPELSYGHSSGKMEDKATFMQSLISKSSDFVTMELSQQTIKIVGNTAIVRHNLNAETVDGGKPGTAKIGVLLIWQKQQGKWKLLARQAFKLP